MSKIIVDFMPNNFRFNKNMQGEICMVMHDVPMTRKIKITSNSNIGDFSGSLQLTPLTRDLAPRSTLV
jgi:hypothetical protein